MDGLVFLTHLLYLMIIVSLGGRFFMIQKLGRHSSSEARVRGAEEKEIIYSILRSKGISLSQGLDIAEVTIQQSRKLNLPVSLILAVMRKESTFTLLPFPPESMDSCRSILPLDGS